MDTILILRPVPSASLDLLNETFKTVHYHPDPVTESSSITKDILSSAEILLTNWAGPPNDLIPSFSVTPKLKMVQITSAGTDKVCKTSAFQEQLQASQDEDEHESVDKVILCNASGIHVTCIPQWCVAQTINLMHQTQKMIIHAHKEKKWAKGTDVGGPLGEEEYYARDLGSKTVGLLGYGALGREIARLMQPFVSTIIAANSSGKASETHDYIVPGTGDKKGTIPSAYYSTKDDASFESFLGQSDILICSLPSTSNTKYMLTAKRLALLPQDSVFLNVGRGDLVKSDDLLAALSKNIYALALDVTDPEPLPPNHALYSHPNVIITPHLSGNVEGETELAVRLLVDNAKSYRETGRFFNVVDVGRGY